jgi:hypothetical protein
VPTISKKTYKILYFILPGYLVLYSTLCVLTIFKVLEIDALFLGNSIINLVTPVLFASYYIFILLKFSGRPYISDTLRTQSNRIFKVVIIWSLTRLVSLSLIFRPLEFSVWLFQIALLSIL